MTRRLSHPWPVDHPEIVAIALDVMLVPARRAHYSSLILMLADAAIDRIRRDLAEVAPAPDGDGARAAPLEAGPS